MPKLRVTPSERHSQPIVSLDGKNIVPAGVPDISLQVVSMGAGTVNRRIAFGDVKEIDEPMVALKPWIKMIQKGDLDPVDAASAKLAGVDEKRVRNPLAKAAKGKADQ